MFREFLETVGTYGLILWIHSWHDDVSCRFISIQLIEIDNYHQNSQNKSLTQVDSTWAHGTCRAFMVLAFCITTASCTETSKPEPWMDRLNPWHLGFHRIWDLDFLPGLLCYANSIEFSDKRPRKKRHHTTRGNNVSGMSTNLQDIS